MKKTLSILLFFFFFYSMGQNQEMLDQTWYLKYLRIDNERIYVPQGENFNLIFSETNGDYTIEANGVENGFSGAISFSALDDFLQFDSAATTLMSCDLPNCYYEDYYFYDLLTSIDGDLKELEYNYTSYSQGLKSLWLKDSNNTFAYFGNEPPVVDESLFDTWYLYQQDVDLGDSQFFTGPDVPRLTINPDFSFTAEDSCGVFSGNFLYGEEFVVDFVLIPGNVDDPNPNCGRALYDLLYEVPMYSSHSDGYLYYESSPGFGSHFRNELLSIPENIFSEIIVYPNPAIETLHIYDPENILEYYTISDISGKIVQKAVHSNRAFSVSNLTPGVYFVTLQSGESYHIKKLIKN
jgi:hypothetical protein